MTSLRLSSPTDNVALPAIVTPAFVFQHSFERFGEIVEGSGRNLALFFDKDAVVAIRTDGEAKLLQARADAQFLSVWKKLGIKKMGHATRSSAVIAVRRKNRANLVVVSDRGRCCSATRNW